MWNYIRALDTANPDAYAATYTPDGQFGTGANAVKGREALRKMIADFKQRVTADEAKGEKRQPLYHMLLNSYVEFSDRDHAHMEAYWLAVFLPARIAGAGREVDEQKPRRSQTYFSADNLPVTCARVRGIQVPPRPCRNVFGALR